VLDPGVPCRDGDGAAVGVPDEHDLRQAQGVEQSRGGGDLLGKPEVGADMARLGMCASKSLNQAAFGMPAR